MEPISAAAITSLLVTYGRHLAGIASDVLDEGIAERLRAVWDKVRKRFSGDDQASGALERLAEQPDNSRRQAALEDHLDEIMHTDAEFTASLAELVEQVGSRSYDNIDVRDAGAVAIGGNVTISGGQYTAGRDVNVSDPKADKPPRK
jgi:hypothetical protein